MKNIKSLIAGLCGVVALTTACSDSDYTEKYDNPAQTTKVTCDRLMTGTLYYGREYTFNAYWRMYTRDNGIIGKYAQTNGFTNANNSMWSAQDSYVGNRWENFYGVLAQFRVLEKTYNELSPEQQKVNLAYRDIAEVFVLDHLAQLLDAFGAVPFHKAGYLGITGDVVNSYPEYDSDVELYKHILDRLGVLAEELAGVAANTPTVVASALPQQDFLNHGDLNRWVKYANALRLRAAVRVATQGDLQAEGKKVVAEVLGKNLPASCDATTDWPAGENLVATPDMDGFNYYQNFRDGYKDHSRASQAMLDVLGADDPRLPVMYSKNAAGQYKGLSTHEALADQENNVSLPESQRVYSRIDSTLFYENKNMLSPIITVAEVDFLRAEARQRGWASGDAKQAFVDGVWHSTQFYFTQNMNSELVTTGVTSYHASGVPAEADVRAYATRIWDAATDKLDLIVSQKWLNFGFFQPSQAWAEVRRTGYHSLIYFPEDSQAQLFKKVPARVRYPSVEQNNNSANYQKALEKLNASDAVNYAYTKLFWAK